METVAVGDSNGGGNCMVSHGASDAPVEVMPQDAAAAETSDKPAEQHCEHFSIRGFVALVQKKDPKYCSLSQIFHDQKQYDRSSCPFLVAKFRRWDCLKCLDHVKISGNEKTSGSVSVKQDGTSDSCSISFVRSVDPKRLSPCTQQSSQKKNIGTCTLSKIAQEGSSKCNSPYGKKGIAEDTYLPTKDLQVSPYDHDTTGNMLDNVSVGVTALSDVTRNISDIASMDVAPLPVVSANISYNASVDVMALPEVTRIRANEDGNCTEIPSNPKPSEVPPKPDGDGNKKTPEILIIDCNRIDVPTPVTGKNGDQICKRGPHEEASSKRCVESSSKKKKDKKKCKKKSKKEGCKPTAQSGVQIENSEVKDSPRKLKKLKTRLLSEIINTDQVEDSRSDTELDHEKVTDFCEDDRNRDDVITVCHQPVGELQSKTKKKAKFKGVDIVDDQSSLMNWLKRTHKKSRTVKDSLHKDFDPHAAKSKFNADLCASKEMNHDFLSSLGNLSKKKLLPIASTQQGDENIQNNNLERNLEITDDTHQIGSGNTSQKVLLKVKTMGLSKRKMPSTANDKHGYENTENSIRKRMVLTTDDQHQMESENSMQRCLAKVSLGKRDVQNAAGLSKQKLSKKTKKRKAGLVPEKQAIMDDIPMDIVELLARNQHERQLMAEADSVDIIHPQSNIIGDDDCPVVAAEYGSDYASPNTNLQLISSTLKGKQKALEVHTASSTQATSTQLQIPEAPAEYTQEQQPHLCMEEVVTIAASSPIFSQHKDQYVTEAPTESGSHKGARKLMWDSFKTAKRDLSTAACASQFRSNIQSVDLTKTHMTGASNDYPTHQTVITAFDHCSKRAVNQVHARSFPSPISTMEVGNLYDGRNASTLCDGRNASNLYDGRNANNLYDGRNGSNLYDGRNAAESGFYQKETMPATHLLRLMDPSTLAGFPNYGTSNKNQMEFPLRNSRFAYNQYKGSTGTSYGNNLYGKVPLTLGDVSLHKLQPLTLEDLSRHQSQPNLQRPLRPLPRVGVLGSFLQEEISNWSENCGTQSGYRIGVSKGITSFDMNRREDFEAMNPGMFSARWNALQLGSVSRNPEFLSARNSTPQSWTRDKGKMAHSLDRFVKQDICVTNRNPSEFTVIGDDNEYMREP